MERQEHGDFGHHHRHPTPHWMGGYWRPNEKHYAALVPGDPSRVYILRGGRWVLRPIGEARFRSDIGQVLTVPAPPLPPMPPVPLPPLPRGLGVDLKVVLFD